MQPAWSPQATPRAGLEGRLHLGLVLDHRGGGVERADQIDRAVGLGEHERLLGRQREAAALVVRRSPRPPARRAIRARSAARMPRRRQVVGRRRPDLA